MIFDDESPNDPSQGNPDTHSYTNSEAEFREVAEASRKEAQLALNHARKAETSSDGPGTSSSPEPTSPVHNSSNSSLSARPIGHREVSSLAVSLRPFAVVHTQHYHIRK